MSRPVFLIQLKWRQHKITPCVSKNFRGPLKSAWTGSLRPFLLPYCDVLPRETQYWINGADSIGSSHHRCSSLMRKIEGMACFFYCKLIEWIHSEMNTDSWRGVVKDVTIMPKPSYWCHERRPIILERRSIFRFGLKIMEANTFIFVDWLAWMNCSPQK